MGTALQLKQLFDSRATERILFLEVSKSVLQF